MSKKKAVTKKPKSKSQMGRAARQKGKLGEREVAQLFRDAGVSGRRTSQFCGKTGDASDVVTDFTHLHIEVKRTETLSLYEAMAQAKRDCGEKTPIVFHRRSGKEWLAILDARVLIELLKKFGVEERICIASPSSEGEEVVLNPSPSAQTT